MPGGEPEFHTVEQRVIIGIRIKRVDVGIPIGIIIPEHFGTVFHPVFIAVGVQRVGSRTRFFTVEKQVIVGIGIIGIGLTGIRLAVQVRVLGAVVEAVIVGIGVEGIGGGKAVRIGDEITGRTRLTGVGGVAAQPAGFGAVVYSVVVTVRIEGVDITVTVGIHPPERLAPVHNPVLIAVGVGGVGPEKNLLVVRQPVPVGIPRGGHAVGAVVRVGLAQPRLVPPVEVEIFFPVVAHVRPAVRIRVDHAGGGCRGIGVRVIETPRSVGIRQGTGDARLGSVENPIVITVRVEGVDITVTVGIGVP